MLLQGAAFELRLLTPKFASHFPFVRALDCYETIANADHKCPLSSQAFDAAYFPPQEDNFLLLAPVAFFQMGCFSPEARYCLSGGDYCDFQVSNLAFPEVNLLRSPFL